MTPLNSVASLDVSMMELKRRVAMYADQVPKQGRWQAELALYDFLEADEATNFFARVDRIDDNVDVVADIFATFPELIDRERVAFMRDVDGQRVAVMAELNAMMTRAFEEVRAERVAMTNDLRAEREAAMAELESMSAALLRQSSDPINSAIDRAFLWGRWDFGSDVARIAGLCHYRAAPGAAASA